MEECRAAKCRSIQIQRCWDYKLHFPLSRAKQSNWSLLQCDHVARIEKLVIAFLHSCFWKGSSSILPRRIIQNSISTSLLMLPWKNEGKKEYERRLRLPVICIMSHFKGSYFWEGIMAPMCDAGGLIKGKPKKPHISVKRVCCLWRRSRDWGDNTADLRSATTVITLSKWQCLLCFSF